MNFLIYINFLARSLVSAFEFVLLVYAVSSWFIRDPYNKFMNIMKAIVDPVVTPIRNILFRFSFFRDCPIDLSLLVVFILCNILIGIL